MTYYRSEKKGHTGNDKKFVLLTKEHMHYIWSYNYYYATKLYNNYCALYGQLNEEIICTTWVGK